MCCCRPIPDDDPRIPEIKKKLRVVCREEEEHVAWGEKETMEILALHRWLRVPYYGLVELQLLLAPVITWVFAKRTGDHPVLSHLPGFVNHVRDRVWQQAKRLGIVSDQPRGVVYRTFCMACGVLLFLRSQLSFSHSTLDKTYLSELGFEG